MNTLMPKPCPWCGERMGHYPPESLTVVWACASWSTPTGMQEQSITCKLRLYERLQIEVAKLRSESLNALAERAAGELPEGWEIAVTVENGGASVKLEDKDFEERDSGPVDCDETMAATFLRLLETAKDEAAKGE